MRRPQGGGERSPLLTTIRSKGGGEATVVFCCPRGGLPGRGCQARHLQGGGEEVPLLTTKDLREEERGLSYLSAAPSGRRREDAADFRHLREEEKSVWNL
jgi:hypothetical protein